MDTNKLKFMVNSLTPSLRECLDSAAQLCVSRTHFALEPEHLLLAMLDDQNCQLRNIVDFCRYDSYQLKNELNESLEKSRTGNTRAPAFSEFTVEWIKDAFTNSQIDSQAEHISERQMFQSLCGDQRFCQLLGTASEFFRILSLEKLNAFYTHMNSQADQASDEAPQRRKVAGATGEGALQSYCIHLTDKTLAAKMDPIIGRNHEIRQLVDILLRKRQNNPILVGEAGVGKTAIVEGFAQEILAGRVPEALAKVEVYTLDLPLLQAGASIKGEFEKRLKALIDEVQKSPVPIILFIDEIHLLVGAGGSEGTGDAANILKPALSRGELRTIGATTWREYKKYFEKDAALTRRFQVVKVEEPTFEQALGMMREIVPSLKKHHEVQILDEAVVAAIKLSQRYIPGRYLPDKCYSLLDTACSRVKTSQTSVPDVIERLKFKVQQLAKEKSVLEQEQEFGIEMEDFGARIDKLNGASENALAELKDKEDQWAKELEIFKKIDELKAEGDSSVNKLKELREELQTVQGESPFVYEWVDENIVADIIKDWTGIPVGKLGKNEISKLLGLYENMQQRVVGQDHALRKISKAIKTSGAKMHEPTLPIGVFMLVGTSGVGKTETALALAELLYGSEKSLITINMSEFKEEHKVSLLLGSPPGYVGYGEGGVLTEAVRKQPYSVVLLDEIEKAHPGVHDIFYQVFDKGMLKDGEGRDIDFKNTVILMTSNVGTETILTMCSSEEGASLPELEVGIKKDLLGAYKAAFLGRTQIVPYLPLSPDILKSIAELKLNKIKRRFAMNYDRQLEFTDEAIEAILAGARDPRLGARQINHAIQNELLPLLSQKVLESLSHDEGMTSMTISFDGEQFRMQD